MQDQTGHAGHVLRFATCGADDAVGLNAVVPVRPEALLFLWRGYADPASRARPGPRFHVARDLLAETFTSLLLANLAHPRMVGGSVVAITGRKHLLWLGGAYAPAAFRGRTCAPASIGREVSRRESRETRSSAPAGKTVTWDAHLLGDEPGACGRPAHAGGHSRSQAVPTGRGSGRMWLR
jgi:hypothetical protein